MSRNDDQEYISTIKLVGDFTLSDRIKSSLHFTYNNYENIVDRIKLNSLPTKKSFINELKKIILV